jgi:two-component system CheB/CheR fusion protein
MQFASSINHELEFQFQSHILNAIQQSVIVTDLTGKIIFWNDFATTLYGWKREEVLGANIIDITPSDLSIDEARAVMSRLSIGEYWSGDFSVKNKSGKTFKVHVHSSPLLNSNNELSGIIGVSYDLSSELKAKEEKDLERLDKESLINSTEDLIWSINRNFELKAGNRTFLDSMKKSHGKNFKAGDNLLDLPTLSPEYLAYWKGLYNKAFNGEKMNVELYSPAVGEVGENWYDMSMNPIEDKGEIIGVACYGRNITEQKQIREEIRTSEERFRVMFTHAPLGIALIDSITGNIYNVNQQFAEITGRSVEELKTINWMQITHPDDIAEDLQNMQLMNEGKIPGFKMQKRYYKPDGSIVWIQMSIAPIDAKQGSHPRHLCMIENISDRKIQEENLRDSNERFEYASKATSDGIWDWNLETNVVVRAGNGLETLFGHNSVEASRDNNFWRKHVHPEDLDRVVDRREKIFKETRDVYWEDEYRYLKADGNYAFVHDKGFIIRDQFNKAIRMIGATQDITSRKEAEMQLRDLNLKLEKRAEELEKSNSELERFAYVASHDLQEPLRMVTSFLGLLEKKYKDQLDSTAQQYIHFAVDGASRMKVLIMDLLQYSRTSRSRDTVGNTDMNEVVKEVMQTFDEKIKELKAVFHISNLPVLPNTRRTQMVQLMQNLVGNALKYHGTNRPEIEISATENEKEITFCVKDNGIGFDKKYAERIFVIFQRLHSKSEYSGTGIGLSICKKIIEIHGGKIWVDSESGKGSSFYFSLPK